MTVRQTWRGVACVLMAAAVSACATTVPVVKPRVVTVTEYVQVPVPPALAAECRVVEPDPACWRLERAVFCNGQLVQMLRDYRLTLATCRAGIESIIAGQTDDEARR